MNPIHIKLYTKRACCLCDKALQVLQNLEPEFPLHVELIDISGSPDLLRRYGMCVPVATTGDRELFRYQADENKLRIALQEQRQGLEGAEEDSSQPAAAPLHFEDS